MGERRSATRGDHASYRSGICESGGPSHPYWPGYGTHRWPRRQWQSRAPGHGTNLIAPAMPIVIERQRVFMGLFGLANNEKFNYPYYFQIAPNGPSPAQEFSRAFFALAAQQNPKLRTVALVGADA